MFSLKVAHDPRLHIRRKNFRKKFRFHGFFLKRIFEKTLFLTFLYSIPYITELKLNTGSMVSYIVEAFHNYILPKIDVKVFLHTWYSWAAAHL